MLERREGCALCVDVLQPPALLNVSLRGDSVDTVFAIKHILKSVTSLWKPATKDPLEWLTAQSLLSKVKEEDGASVHQGAVLQGFDNCKSYCKQQALEDLQQLEGYTKSRLEWSITLFHPSLTPRAGMFPPPL